MLKVKGGAILMLMSPQDARTKQRILLSHVSLCMLQWFNKTDVGCRWWQATGRDQDSSSSCLTLETSSPCHFPFEHNGFLHYSCIPLTPQVNFGIMLFILVLRKMIWLLWEKKAFSLQGRQQCPVAPDSPTSTWEHCKVQSVKNCLKAKF